MKWKLVLVEPTEEMLFQGQGYIDCEGRQASVVFQAMLTAAPDPFDDAEFVEWVARAMLASTGDLSDFIDNISDFPEKVFSGLARAAIAAMTGRK